MPVCRTRGRWWRTAGPGRTAGERRDARGLLGRVLGRPAVQPSASHTPTQVSALWTRGVAELVIHTPHRSPPPLRVGAPPFAAAARRSAVPAGEDPAPRLSPPRRLLLAAPAHLQLQSAPAWLPPADARRIPRGRGRTCSSRRCLLPSSAPMRRAPAFPLPHTRLVTPSSSRARRAPCARRTEAS